MQLDNLIYNLIRARETRRDNGGYNLVKVEKKSFNFVISGTDIIFFSSYRSNRKIMFNDML